MSDAGSSTKSSGNSLTVRNTNHMQTSVSLWCRPVPFKLLFYSISSDVISNRGTGVSRPLRSTACMSTDESVNRGFCIALSRLCSHARKGTRTRRQVWLFELSGDFAHYFIVILILDIEILKRMFDSHFSLVEDTENK